MRHKQVASTPLGRCVVQHCQGSGSLCSDVAALAPPAQTAEQSRSAQRTTVLACET